MRRLLLSTIILLALAAVAAWGPRAGDTLAAQSRQAPAGTAHTGKAFRFNQVKPGIYHAIGTGALAVVGNSSFIVNDEDVIVVDDHVSPAAAWVLLEEIKEITNKPVRTVINTHFHFDHAHGNQIFDSRVDIIGHEFTRQMLLNNSIGMPLYRNYVTGLPGQIDDLKKRLAAETDAGRQAALRTQISVAENNRAAQAELKPTPPNVTLTDRMTLYRGSREIQIRFLGRGHTAGDVVVYLPRERVVATGDFLTSGLSNMSDAYLDEWVTSLDALKGLDFDTVHAGPRRSVHRQGQDRLFPGLPARRVDGSRQAEAPGRVGGGRRQTRGHDEAQRALSDSGSRRAAHRRHEDLRTAGPALSRSLKRSGRALALPLTQA